MSAPSSHIGAIDETGGRFTNLCSDSKSAALGAMLAVGLAGVAHLGWAAWAVWPRARRGGAMASCSRLLSRLR